MTTEHVLIIVVAIAVIAVLVWALAAVLNPPKSAEHDIRRRTLKWMCVLAPVPGGIVVEADTVPTAIVGVTALVVWCVVMVVALRGLFPTHPPPSAARCAMPPAGNSGSQLEQVKYEQRPP